MYMDENVWKDCSLEVLSSDEMQIRGGSRLRELWKLIEQIGELIDELREYWPDFERGFKKGWDYFE